MVSKAKWALGVRSKKPIVGHGDKVEAGDIFVERTIVGKKKTRWSDEYLLLGNDEDGYVAVRVVGSPFGAAVEGPRYGTHGMPGASEGPWRREFKVLHKTAVRLK
jgi:hypothetical protein